MFLLAKSKQCCHTRQVRNYAIQLGIETKKPNKKKVGQYDNISKNDLISAIIKKLNENK